MYGKRNVSIMNVRRFPRYAEVGYGVGSSYTYVRKIKAVADKGIFFFRSSFMLKFTAHKPHRTSSSSWVLPDMKCISIQQAITFCQIGLIRWWYLPTYHNCNIYATLVYKIFAIMYAAISIF